MSKEDGTYLRIIAISSSSRGDWYPFFLSKLKGFRKFVKQRVTDYRTGKNLESLIILSIFLPINLCLHPIKMCPSFLIFSVELQVRWFKYSESEVAQLCPTLCDPMDCSPPGSSVHGIFQARKLEWVAISFSRRSSRSRD